MISLQFFEKIFENKMQLVFTCRNHLTNEDILNNITIGNFDYRGFNDHPAIYQLKKYLVDIPKDRIWRLDEKGFPSLITIMIFI
jgi:hypothetical protein